MTGRGDGPGSRQAVELDSVLPHAAPMILLDDVVRIGETSVQGSVRIGEDSLFYEAPMGVPSYVGIEYIAQTVAAHAGMVAHDSGYPVRVGFLLGTRRYACSMPHFPLGALLTVHVAAVYEAPRICKFSGTISDAKLGEVASCMVSVYLRGASEGTA